MFNRQLFNRGRFSRPLNSANSIVFTGTVDLGVEAEAEKINVTLAFNGHADITLELAGQMNYAVSFDGNADLQLNTDGNLIRARNFEGHTDIAMTADGNLIRGRVFHGNALITLTLASTEGFNTFRYEHVHLPGLLVRPGDELIIDMENMTVTLNGQNVMRFLHRNSEFFTLNPGNNEITYESTVTNGRVDMRVLWKDAWL